MDGVTVAWCLNGLLTEYSLSTLTTAKLAIDEASHATIKANINIQELLFKNKN
jgi:hypothetical protein